MRPRLHELTGRNAENVSRITLQVKAETEDAFKGEDRRARIEGGYNRYQEAGENASTRILVQGFQLL